jgi:branched-chain amino acid transport system ATP-binding protein
LLLQLDNVAKSFKGLMAVNFVSMEVNEGEILGLIGPNGAGKTTLFITGFSSTRGKIVFEGKDITTTAPHKRSWMGIARTFQLVRIFPELTILENATIGRVYGSESVKNRARAEKEAESFLEMVGLASRRQEKASSNVGKSQGLELARAWQQSGCCYW